MEEQRRGDFLRLASPARRSNVRGSCGCVAAAQGGKRWRGRQRRSLRARRCTGADDRSRGGATEEGRRGGFLMIMEVPMVMGNYG